MTTARPMHGSPATQPQSPEACFAAALSRDPGRPLITFYDQASGERIELSAKSLANWVAKTHHLIGDVLGLGVGSSALVDLPLHWMAAPVLLGCWSAGLRITDEAAEADCAFVGPAAVEAAVEAGVPEVLALSLAPMGRPYDPAPPPGCEDYVLSVRPMPDAWSSVRFSAGPDDPAWQDVSRASVVASARGRAADLGLVVGGRLLAARPWDGASGQGWLDALVAPLAVGASVVLVRLADDAREQRGWLERISAAERTTATVS